MTELQAALGLSQLDRLRQFIHHRIKATEIYQQLLADVAVELPASAIDGISAWHLYIIRLENSTERLAVFQALRAAGIGVNVHYIPIHTQPYYQARGFQWGDFPGAEKFYSQIISLPMYATITFEQQQQVADALKQALAHGQPSPSASV
jgi:dTDP-4-amino-4,6-dideoxygalactose transaminase